MLTTTHKTHKYMHLSLQVQRSGKETTEIKTGTYPPYTNMKPAVHLGQNLKRTKRKSVEASRGFIHSASLRYPHVPTFLQLWYIRCLGCKNQAEGIKTLKSVGNTFISSCNDFILSKFHLQVNSSTAYHKAASVNSGNRCIVAHTLV